MAKIAVGTIESFKKRAAHVRPFTKNQSHGQALELLALLCGYPTYRDVAKADLSVGEEISLNDVAATLMQVRPGLSRNAAFAAAVKLNLHTKDALDRCKRVLKGPADFEEQKHTTREPAAPRASSSDKPAVTVIVKKSRAIVREPSI